MGIDSRDGALKLILSNEWTDGINWFFACWYRLTKIKSWANIYCVGMVKNRCGQSGHGTLKLTVSKTEQMEETDLLHTGTN